MKLLPGYSERGQLSAGHVYLVTCEPAAASEFIAVLTAPRYGGGGEILQRGGGFAYVRPSRPLNMSEMSGVASRLFGSNVRFRAYLNSDTSREILRQTEARDAEIERLEAVGAVADGVRNVAAGARDAVVDTLTTAGHVAAVPLFALAAGATLAFIAYRKFAP